MNNNKAPKRKRKTKVNKERDDKFQKFCQKFCYYCKINKYK